MQKCSPFFIFITFLLVSIIFYTIFVPTKTDKYKIMTFSTTTLNGKTEQVIVMKTSKKEACTIGELENKKGLTPVVVSFGSDDIFIGYGYTVEDAINNAKIQ